MPFWERAEEKHVAWIHETSHSDFETWTGFWFLLGMHHSVPGAKMTKTIKTHFSLLMVFCKHIYMYIYDVYVYVYVICINNDVGILENGFQSPDRSLPFTVQTWEQSNFEFRDFRTLSIQAECSVPPESFKDLGPQENRKRKLKKSKKCLKRSAWWISSKHAQK